MQVGLIGAGDMTRALARGCGGPVLEQREHDRIAVRREVTSPGGWTARGRAALQGAGVHAAFHDEADAVVGAGT